MRALLIVLLVAAPKVPDDHVADALKAAGENRPQLEQVLAHFKDPQEATAARFLIANMPGHGYIRTRLVTKQGKVLSYDPLAY